MDDRRFDALVRALAIGPAPRRQALHLLAGGALSPVLARLRLEEAAAACFGTLCGGTNPACCKGTVCGPAGRCCRAAGGRCKKSRQCCSGRCGGNGKCRCTPATCPQPSDECKEAFCGGGRCDIRNKPADTRCGAGACDGNGNCGECTPGDTRSCYSGPGGTQRVGECRDGTQTCGNDRTWGQCDGEMLPGTEVCNGKDDDCDGVSDIGATCSGGRSCVDGECQCPSEQPNYCQDTDSCREPCPSPKQFKPATCACECPNGMEPSEAGCICTPNRSDCNLDLTDGCECPTPGCCDNRCQTTHSNGLGQNYYDCKALDLHEPDQAALARNAYEDAGDPGTIRDPSCFDGSTVTCLQRSAECACWAYSGPAKGHVRLNTANSTCLCPDAAGDPSWN